MNIFDSIPDDVEYAYPSGDNEMYRLEYNPPLDDLTFYNPVTTICHTDMCFWRF